MNTTTQFLIAGAIIVSIAAQFGRRRLSWWRLALPLVIVIGFAVYYLKTIPTSGGDGWFTLAGLVSGLALGVLAAILLGMERQSGRIIMTAGIAYVALWVAVFGARLAFVEIASNSPDTLRSLFVWAYQHGITEAGWTAAFMLQALAMVGLRTAIVAARALAGRGPLASLAA